MNFYDEYPDESDIVAMNIEALAEADMFLRFAGLTDAKRLDIAAGFVTAAREAVEEFGPRLPPRTYHRLTASALAFEAISNGRIKRGRRNG